MASAPANTPFDDKLLSEALDSFFQDKSNDSSLYLGMLSSRRVIDGQAITFYLNDADLADKANLYKTRLVDYLRIKLNNSEVNITIEVGTSDEASVTKKSLVTSSEKLEYFRTLNPAVDDFIKILSLEKE